MNPTQMTIRVPANTYDRLMNKYEREACEAELRMLFQYCAIEKLQQGERKWQKNGKLTGAEVDAMMCPLNG